MPPLRRAVAGMDDADSACSGGVASSKDNDRRKAIAKLVDMGFAPEESRRALAEEAEDREAGGEPAAALTILAQALLAQSDAASAQARAAVTPVRPGAPLRGPVSSERGAPLRSAPLRVTGAEDLSGPWSAADVEAEVQHPTGELMSRDPRSPQAEVDDEEALLIEGEWTKVRALRPWPPPPPSPSPLTAHRSPLTSHPPPPPPPKPKPHPSPSPHPQPHPSPSPHPHPHRADQGASAAAWPQEHQPRRHPARCGGRPHPDASLPTTYYSLLTAYHHLLLATCYHLLLTSHHLPLARWAAPRRLLCTYYSLTTPGGRPHPDYYVPTTHSPGAPSRLLRTAYYLLRWAVPSRQRRAAPCRHGWWRTRRAR